jgi:nucleotide-binding universal stress UspA family protein
MTEPVDLDHCDHPVWVAVDEAVPLATMVDATRAADPVDAVCKVVDKTVRAALIAVGYPGSNGLSPSGPGPRLGRAQLGEAVRAITTAWAQERDDRSGTGLESWEQLDTDVQELHMRVGEQLYALGRNDPSTAGLAAHDEAVAAELYRLVREHTSEPGEGQ